MSQLRLLTTVKIIVPMLVPILRQVLKENKANGGGSQGIIRVAIRQASPSYVH
jgi:hypothetical protein